MTTFYDRRIAALVVCACLAVAACRNAALPRGIGDGEWWELIGRLSEPHRDFRVSDNLVSNEAGFAERVRWLRPSGGVYIGVGPEQNFSYIAALEPEVAFIVDIRRDNLLLHLIYKALFELSTDRSELVAQLFSRSWPAGLTASSTAEEIFAELAAAPAERSELDRNVARVLDRLVTTRSVPLTASDREGIVRTMTEFQRLGPGIQYWDATSVEVQAPSYRELMVAHDSTGAQRSFLASNAAFRLVKDLHTRNLIVPVVGDFAGPRTLRRIGDYAREHGAAVQAFYASNVSAYLNDSQAREFCLNLLALPVADRAAFVEGNRWRPMARKRQDCQSR